MEKERRHIYQYDIDIIISRSIQKSTFNPLKTTYT